MTGQTPGFSAGGERLLELATEVFYTEGIRATGVDTLAARAGVSKPTLYAQFGSKDGLVAAVLDRRRADRQAALTRFLAEYEGSPIDRLLAVFDWLGRGHRRDGFRGCPFTNAAVELPDPASPARKVISAYKQWLRRVFTDLARQAGLDGADQLGYAMLLLVDGANARVVVDGERTAMQKARAAAATLVTTHERGDT